MRALALSFVVPGPIDQRTGGYIYDRRIVEGLRAAGASVAVHELPGRHPLPDGEARAAAAALLDALPDGRPVVIDGLALPSFETALPRHAARLPVVALVHHPLALERGANDAEALDRAERAALACARRIVVTSSTTATGLRAAGIAADRIGVVVPGCDFAGTAPVPPRPRPDALRMLCVGTLTQRKGHLVLIEALAGLDGIAWRLNCVGSLHRDEETVLAVRRAIADHALVDRVHLLDERPVAQLEPFYRRADLFVLPSWHEGYGMVLAEALSFGLPIVSTTAGAIPEVVPADAGILVPPGDAASLRDALARVARDAALRADMAAAARAARFPDWADAAAAFAAEMETAEIATAPDGITPPPR